MGILRKIFTPKSQLSQIPTANGIFTRHEGETYTAYGTRICAKVYGSVAVLGPCLQRIYLYEKQLQNQDGDLQRRTKLELENQLNDINGKLSQLDIEGEEITHKISDNADRLVELQRKLTEVKNIDGENNKMAHVKLTIGLLILLILSVYLFIFYSSTFYSAFFKEFTFDTSVAEAMFDSQAIPNALNNGLGCLMFIFCAPVIFMGLGYVLHYYMSEEGKMKVFKVTGIVIITFIFDCILAYLIAKHIYDVEALTKMDEIQPFSLSIAITDVNVWAVIFCGFITYMIWGFVFDLTISAYEEIKSNKKEIDKVENDIKGNREQKSVLDVDMANVKKKKATLESDKNKIQNQLSSSTLFFDKLIIKTALTDFFTGWLTIMSPMGHSMDQQEKAKEIFNNTINSLFN